MIDLQDRCLGDSVQSKFNKRPIPLGIGDLVDAPGGGGEYQSKRGLGTPCRGVKQCIKRRREVLIQNGLGVLGRGVGET